MLDNAVRTTKIGTEDPSRTDEFATYMRTNSFEFDEQSLEYIRVHEGSIFDDLDTALDLVRVADEIFDDYGKLISEAEQRVAQTATSSNGHNPSRIAEANI